jgi:hypothetical protein
VEQRDDEETVEDHRRHANECKINVSSPATDCILSKTKWKFFSRHGDMPALDPLAAVRLGLLPCCVIKIGIDDDGDEYEYVERGEDAC